MLSHCFLLFPIETRVSNFAFLVGHTHGSTIMRISNVFFFFLSIYKFRDERKKEHKRESKLSFVLSKLREDIFNGRKQRTRLEVLVVKNIWIVSSFDLEIVTINELDLGQSSARLGRVCRDGTVDAACCENNAMGMKT